MWQLHPSTGKILFFQESGKMMEQLTQVGCGICIPGDIQSSSGDICQQPDLIGPTLSKDWSK